MKDLVLFYIKLSTLTIFQTLLVKIRELLWSLTESELLTLEKMLCSSEDSSVLAQKHSILR